MKSRDDEAPGPETMAMLARVIEVGADPDALFTRILDLVVEATGADAGFIIFADAEGEMRFRGGHNITEQEAGPNLPALSSSAVRRVLRTGLPYAAGPPQLDRDGAASARALAIRWLLCFPIPRAGKTAGVVYLDQRHDGPGFTEAHLKLLRQFSERIAQVIQDASGRIKAPTERVPRIHESLQKLRRSHAFEGMIGTSAPMRELFDRLRAAAGDDDPILIGGEPGSGRRRAAEAIHRRSARAAGPRLILRAAGMNPRLFEKAIEQLAPQARGGILVVTEIESACRPAAARFLSRTPDPRLLLTGPEDWSVPDARRIQVPPLRERPDDLPHLIEHFLDLAAAAVGRPAPTLEPETLDLLLTYRWPGNVAELEREIRRLTMLDRPAIRAADLPAWIRGAADVASEGPLARRLAAFERRLIVDELRRCAGDADAAAAALGLSTRALRRKMKDYGLDTQ